jgi:uncharacterized protein YutE (UPF0331/DUF86 family)
MNVASAEAIVFEKLVPELRSEGYDVFLNPGKELVPNFLGSYRPDLIALRDDKNLVVEVKARSSSSDPTDLDALAKLFEGQSGWELRVFWINPNQDRNDPELQSDEDISARLEEIARMRAAGFNDSAMLLCWATFEAVGRRLMQEQFSRPQTPGRLVQVLASEGYVTPDEADFLRRSASLRNRLIHGELSTHVDSSAVQTFLGILESLAEPALAPRPGL